MDQSVILDCRHLWKLYGPAAQALLAGGKTPDAATLAAANVIGAVRDVNVQIHQGEIFVIMGLSGSGKSTLVRCLSRLIDPTEGQVLIDGNDITKASHSELKDLRRNKMAMVFQHFGLFPHRKVIDNVAYGPEVRGEGREQRYEKAMEVINLVGLDGWADNSRG